MSKSPRLQNRKKSEKSSLRSSSNSRVSTARSRQPSTVSSKSKKSSSASTAKSHGSKKTYNTWNNAYNKNSRRAPKTQRKMEELIYEGTESYAPVVRSRNPCSVALVLQFFLMIYGVGAQIFVAWENNASRVGMWNYLALFEISAGIVMLSTIPITFVSTRIASLYMQYFLFFHCFCGVVEYFPDVDTESYHLFYTQKIGYLFFHPFVIHALFSFLHFMIVLFSLELIGSAEITDQFTDNLIIEPSDKRKKKVFMMLADVMKTICMEDNQTNVGLVVTDETGHPVKLDGANVSTDVQRKVVMKMKKDEIELSTTNSAGTAVEIPKEDKVTMRFINKPAPMYNLVEKQDQMYSPAKVF